MTPKEKAKELYDKYEFVYIQNYTSKHEVKQCVSIAVDEILEIEQRDLVMGNYNEIDYWAQVKAELEKL